MASQPDLSTAALQMALGLLVILGVIYAAFYLLKKVGHRFGLANQSKPGALTLQGHLQLGPKKSLMVVRFLNKMLVLGVTEQSINLLTETDYPDVENTARDFAEDLAAAESGGGPDAAKPS